MNGTRTICLRDLKNLKQKSFNFPMMAISSAELYSMLLPPPTLTRNTQKYHVAYGSKRKYVLGTLRSSHIIA